MQKFSVKSPLDGSLVPLEGLDDEVFSDKMLGDGIAILPSSGNVLAPVDGEVISVAQTLHAVGIKSDGGAQILIHCGIDTVTLKGSGFQVFVKKGDKVRTGDLILKMDLDMISANGLGTYTPVIVTNISELQEFEVNTNEKEVFAGTTEIISYSKS